MKPQPVLEFIRPYTPDLVGWFRDFGQGAANYDANGHFARIQPIFNAFQFTDNPAGGVLTPIPPSAALRRPADGIERRCPGAATQRPPDGSAPFTDDGNCPTTATRASCRPDHDARRRPPRLLIVARGSPSFVRHGRRRRRRRLQGARDLRQRRLRHPGRGRQGRRRQGRQDRLARRHGGQQGRRRAQDHRPRLPGLPQRRRAARCARSR